MQEIINKNKGQMAIVPVAITAVATILASVIGGWSSANSRVGSVDTKVQVIEERENNHYEEVQKKLEKIDDKLDLLLNQKTR